MSNNSNYAIDIIVNGNTCKQYNHNGKIYIEAKNGSEYEIRIKNNTYQRILAISSVDSLNVLTGEAASTEDTGYVISAYNSLKIDGYRYNDNSVGAFKFGKKSKGTSYAKLQGEEANVGVIGVKLFNEKVNTPLYWPLNSVTGTGTSYNNPDWTYTTTAGGHSNNIIRSMNASATDVHTLFCQTSLSNNSSNTTKCCGDFESNIAPNFDMATEWGRSKESKVTTVEFVKGVMAFEYDIYYTSRKSLIDIGVQLGNEVKVSFPSSFPKKYATPPPGWR
jgi:hypothetical protein